MAEKEYIERKAAENIIDRFAFYLDDDMIFRIKYAIRKHIPAADVAPVRHGHWIVGASNGRSYQKCSECCSLKIGQLTIYPCCPICGAKMDGCETK